MLPSMLTNFLVPLLGLGAPPSSAPPSSAPESQPQTTPLHFELRQLHAVTSDTHVVFSDVFDSRFFSHNEGSYTISRTVPLTVYKPPSFDALINARRSSWDYPSQSAALDWNEDTVVGPDVESRETLLLLAKMTNNAYLTPKDAGWYDLGGNWSVVRVLSRNLITRILLCVLVSSVRLATTL